MTRIIECIKFGPDQVGLDAPPFPGAKGQNIYEHVSAKAWEAWLAHQTMLVNEHRLNPLDRSTKVFLMQEMDKFFQGDSQKPAGYVDSE
jgi:Fe-S cluster biosynthesis and repair protein YggX